MEQNKRQRVLMICAHEPNLDPRIRWEAEAAVPRFEVTVLGFNRDDFSLPEDEISAGYRIIRLKRPSLSGLTYFWRLKDVIPTDVLVPLGVALVLLAPLLVLAEIGGRGLRGLFRLGSRFAPIARLLQTTRLAALLDRLRGQVLMRLEYILAVLRLQFAPATVAFLKHLHAMPEAPDIVHCNDLDTLLVGVLAKRRYGCRLIYDAHEFYPVSDPHGKWLDITLFTWIERLLIRNTDAAITVNPPLAEAMRATYRLDRVYAVPNAEPWAEHRVPPAADGEMARLAQGRIKFLFQGRFTSGRGIEEMIEGWSGVDAGRAALFLRGPENMWRKAAIEQAAARGLLDRGIYFLDAVSEDELVSAAAEADVGIVPYKPLIINDRLSCPNKLSQYLHAGLMVVANDLPYVQSVLTEAGAGACYNSADPRTLADAVQRIVDDPELLQRSRRNALHYARSCFNWQVQSEILYALYRGNPDRSELARLPTAQLPQASV